MKFHIKIIVLVILSSCSILKFDNDKRLMNKEIQSNPNNILENNYLKVTIDKNDILFLKIIDKKNDLQVWSNGQYTLKTLIGIILLRVILPLILLI